VNIVHSQGEKSRNDGWRSIGLVWGVTVTPARGPRPRFNVHQVAQAAIELADADGLAAVTMANVAVSLELTTTALYRYVDAKETLIELMVDDAAGPPPSLALTADWRAPVRVWTAAMWDCYRAHPWLNDVRPTRFPRCPNAIAWVESLLTILEAAPVSDPMDLLLQINLTIRSYASLANSLAPPTEPPAWFVAALTERFPRVVASGVDVRDPTEGFWTAIDRLLAAEDNRIRGGNGSKTLRRSTARR
jgi:AcrR family transcriptional regulator